MNAHQRRVFRRELDRLLPIGRLVNIEPDRVLMRVHKRSVFDRPEYTKVMVESAEKPFGYTSVHYSKVRLA